jgi:hypothetical protein
MKPRTAVERVATLVLAQGRVKSAERTGCEGEVVMYLYEHQRLPNDDQRALDRAMGDEDAPEIGGCASRVVNGECGGILGWGWLVHGGSRGLHHE